MILRPFLFILLLISSLYAEPQSDFLNLETRSDSPLTSSTNFSGVPNSVVHGCVNVVSGDYFDVQEDMVIEGPEPLIIKRFYSSSDFKAGTLQNGWHLSYQGQLEVSKRTDDPDPMHHASFVGPMGVKYSLTKKNKYHSYKFTKKSLKGITNCFDEEISARTNLKNTVLTAESLHLMTLREANGNLMVFQTYATDQPLRIRKEIRPSKNSLQYNYDKNDRLASVCAVNPRKMSLNNFTIHYDKKKPIIEIKGSNTQSVTYKYEYAEEKSNRVGDRYKSMCLLRKVKRPDAPTEEYTYASFVLERSQDSLLRHKKIIQKDRPEGRSLGIDYYTAGQHIHPEANEVITLKDNHEWIGRVKSLRSPVGVDGSLHPIYQFFYHFPESKHKAGICSVYDAHLIKTNFHWDDNQRLTHINKLDKHRQLYSSEQLEWGKDSDNTNLKSRTLSKPQGEIFKISYVYDMHGNVLEEILEGDLQGKGLKDRYVKTASYTSIPFHLKTEEKDGVTHKIYAYKPETDLVISCFTFSEGVLRKRQFFDYDANNILIKEIIDDGDFPDRNNLTGVTCQKIRSINPLSIAPYNLPEIEEQKYLDLSTNQEALLHRTKNQYAVDGKLIQQDHFDANGQFVYSLHWQYDHKGNLICETDALGQTTTRQYDANQNCIFEQGPRKDHHKSFQYDFANRLVTEMDVHADKTLKTTYHYNYLSQRVAKIDPFGQKTDYLYDEFGRLIQTIYPPKADKEGVLTHTGMEQTYDVQGYVTSTRDSYGFVTSQANTIRGKPYLITQPDGSQERLEYDLNGRVIKHISKTGSYTLYAYDYENRMTNKETYSSSGEFLFSNTATYRHNLLSETDPEGIVTTYNYDDAGRLISKKQGDLLETLEYDSLGRVKRKVTHTESPIIQEMEYDLLNRLILERTLTTKGDIQKQIAYVYDQEGHRTHLIQEVDGKPSVTETQYNSCGLPSLHIDAEGNQTHYAYHYNFTNEYGQCVFVKEETDPLGNVTLSIFDTQGHIVTHLRKDAFGEIVQQRQYTYDGNQNLIQTIDHVKNPSKTIINQWQYNAMQEVVKQIEALDTPEQKIITHQYNAFGQKENTTKPDGTKLYYTYDTLGRLKTFTADDKSFCYQYTYDRHFNVTQVDDSLSNTKTLRTYDQNGHLASEKLANDLTLNYKNDVAGRLTTFTLPDQTTVDYHYDGEHLSEIHRGQEKHCYAYDKSGKILLSHHTKMQYTPRGLTTTIQHPQWNCQYTYNSIGNLISKKSESEVHYQYDSLHQLTQEKGSIQNDYTYDSLYNRTSKNAIPQELNHLNQIVSVGNVAYHYDANGNLLNDAEATYSYDALDRLTEVKKNGKTYRYTYDAFNRRLSKKTPTETIRYLYTQDNEIGAVNAKGEVTELRVLGIGKGAEIGAAVFIELNKKLYRPLHDLQGSVIGLLNNDKLVASYDYTAFGEEILKSDDLSPWRFSSKRYDAETDFLYFGRRYYSPKLGRWITPDPIGYEGGPNLYAYVSNNPLMLFDLYGLDAHPCADSVGANWFRSVGDTLSNAWNSVKETCSGFFTSQREVTPDRFKDAVQRGRERSADVPIARLCGVVGHWYLQRYHPEVLKEDGWEAFASVGAEMGSLFVGDLQQAMPAPPVSRVAHPILKSISTFFKKANVGKKVANSTTTARVTNEFYKGRKGCELKFPEYQTNRNIQTIIQGRKYTGHSLDQMQNRGIVPSVVENTLKLGEKFRGKEINTTAYYDAVNNVTVIKNSMEEIVTVSHGWIKQ